MFKDHGILVILTIALQNSVLPGRERRQTWMNSQFLKGQVENTPNQSSHSRRDTLGSRATYSGNPVRRTQPRHECGAYPDHFPIFGLRSPFRLAIIRDILWHCCIGFPIHRIF